MEDTTQAPAAPASGGLTPYFQQLASVLNVPADQYHNGSGGGQADPNQAMANLPGLPPNMMDMGSAPQGASGSAAVPQSAASGAPPVPASPAAASVPAPSTTGDPGTAVAASDIQAAQNLIAPKSAADKLGEASRQLGAAFYGPQVLNQTIESLDSHDQATRKAASDTVAIAKQVADLTKEGYDINNLAIAAANQKAWALQANDPNSTLTQFTRQFVSNSLDQTTGISPEFKQTILSSLPKMTAYDIMNSQIMNQVAGVGALSQTNIKNSIALADEATKRITANASTVSAQAALGQAGAHQTEAATGARNQNMLENASGVSGNAPGTPATVVAPTAPGTPSTPAAPKPASKYVVNNKGIELSPAEKGTQEEASKEVATVRTQQSDLADTLQKIEAAKASVASLPFAGPVMEYAGHYSDAVQKAKAQLAGVGLAYTKAFAEDAGARAGGNMMIEQKEQANVGDLSQNKKTIINSLNRMEQSIKSKQDYNNQIMDQSKKDPSLETFKYTPLYNSKSWLRHTDKSGNQAYVSPDGSQFEAVQ